jgi:hypothetical protein
MGNRKRAKNPIAKEPTSTSLSFWEHTKSHLPLPTALTKLFSSSFFILSSTATLGAAASATAAQYALQFISGQYQNLNTCLGDTFSCLQGYALNGTELAFRWSRSVESSSGSLSDVFFQHLMKEVITEERMQTLFEQALSGTGLSKDVVCSFPTSTWSSISALGQAIGLDEKACNTAKLLFSSLAAEAHSTAARTWLGMIAGGSLGALAVLAIAATAYCCYKNGCPSLPCREKNSYLSV